MIVVVFFQAEDGIRDYKVTGVQTCALPISVPEPRERGTRAQAHSAGPRVLRRVLQNHQRPGPYTPGIHSVVPAVIRWDVPGAERLDELLATPPPLGLRAGPTQRTFHRDLYFDTPDGDLHRRGATCRLRFDVDDRRALALDVAGVAQCESRVLELEPRHIFGGDTEPARRLRAIVQPRRLAPQVELEIERRMRAARLPLVLVPQFVLAYDIITAREGTEGRPYEFHELAAWRRPWGVIPATRFARAIEQRYGVSRGSADRLPRGPAPRAAPPAIARQAAVVAVAHRRLALWSSGAALRLPLEDGGR